MKLALSLLFFGCIYLSGPLVFSGVGGIGGGSKAGYVAISMCDGGEAGNQCHVIRLNAEFFDENGNLKPSSHSEPLPCMTYEGEGYSKPCGPEIQYRIPKFLQKLNNFFGTQGQPVQAVNPYVN